MKQLIYLTFTLSALLNPVWGQTNILDQTEPLSGGLALPLSEDNTTQSLEALLKSVESKQKEVSQLQEQLQGAPDEVTRKEILESIAKRKKELNELESKFESFAASVDISAFVDKPKEKFDWQEKVGELLEPVFKEIENATKTTRQKGALRSDVERFSERAGTASNAVMNIDHILQESLSPELQGVMGSLKEKWIQRREDARNQAIAARLQLEKLEEETKHFNPAESAQKFFRSRGLNLILGVLAFCAVFFGIRFLVAVWRKFRPNKDEKKFTSRLISLIVHSLSVLGALAATLLVFNIMGDLFLQVIVLIFLFGIAWASIKTLPQHVETVRLMLNIGAVKEGQRIVLDGVPWKVDSLAFTARLVNDRLDGGEIILPIRLLVGMHSRPIGHREELFPCKPGDWVALADGHIGRVSYQNPGMVQLTELGGAQIVYQTPDFLAQNPRNLSTGYRVETVFGVDYKHQAIATTEIPKTLLAHLKEHLPSVVDAEHIRNVQIEVKAAGASSIDYEIEVDLSGEAADCYEKVEHALQELCIDACNKHGWEIPFTQIMLHKAE